MTTNSKKNIGIIGTGIIGLPLAVNLIKKKYKVYSHIRNKNRSRLIKNSGVVLLDTLDELFSMIDILILAVSETKDVKNILVGKNGMNKFKKNHL